MKLRPPKRSSNSGNVALELEVTIAPDSVGLRLLRFTLVVLAVLIFLVVAL